MQTQKERSIMERVVLPGTHAYEDYTDPETKTSCAHQETYMAAAYERGMQGVDGSRSYQPKQLFRTYKRKSSGKATKGGIIIMGGCRQARILGA